MPWNEQSTVQEAREEIASFLDKTGCYDICAHCPVYPGGEGCCHGCPNLMKGVGCSTPNLSCLSYTCGVLNEHLRRHGKLDEFISMTYGVPREGYRGCQRRGDSELLQIQDPLEDVVAEVRIGILSEYVKEEASE